MLAELARGRMRAKHAALVEALTGRFDDHHAELARMLLDQIDALTAQIDQLTARIDGADRRDARRASGVDADGTTGPGAGQPAPDAAGAARRWPRLDEIPGIGRARRPGDHRRDRPGHDPVPHRRRTWCPGPSCAPAPSSPGHAAAAGKTGKGNPYLKGVLGEAAAAAAKTDTFLGERYRRLVKRRGKLKALVAVARSILVIIWHLLADPAARFHDLGADYHTNRIDTDTQDPQPHPPARSPRLHRHPHPSRRLTQAAVPSPQALTDRTSQGRCRAPTKGEIYRSADGRGSKPFRAAADTVAKPLDNACPGPTALKCWPSTLNRLEDHDCGAISP